jgi:elongation factor Ts
MAEVTLEQVKELRHRTKAGMMDCKKALAEAEGDLTKAEELLRARRKVIADKATATREAGVGVIGTYTHHGSRIGAMVEVRCETDFVAQNEAFQALVKDLCLQIAASAPQVVERAELDQQVIDREREVLIETLKEEGKPENMLARIAEGMLEKAFYKTAVLLEQDYVKDPKRTVGDLVSEVSGTTGEKVVVRRFARFEA